MRSRPPAATRGERAPRTKRTRGRSRLVAIALGLTLLGTTTAVALGDPTVPPDGSSVPVDTQDPGYTLSGSPVEQQTPAGNPSDTPFTPTAKKPPDTWHMLGGAQYGAHSVSDKSVTPYTVDFYAVRSISENDAYAVGAA